MQDARERSSQYIKGPPPQAPLLLFRGFSALVPPRGERRGQQGPRKRGTTSRARVSTRTSATEKDPLLRPYYIVYLSSEPSPILALLVFFLLLPARLLHRYLLALRLLVSRNKQLPFSFAYKSATQLRTCPSKRTVNRSLGVIIVTYYWVIGEKKRRGVASPLRRCNRKKRNDQAGIVVKILNGRSLVFIVQWKNFYLLLTLENLLIMESFLQYRTNSSNSLVRFQVFDGFFSITCVLFLSLSLSLSFLSLITLIEIYKTFIE